jgi:hypothetical protein
MGLISAPLSKVVETFADYQIRDRESFSFACEINKPFGALDAVLDWCRSELCYDWRWQLIRPSSDIHPGRYCFYFDNERDHLCFILKWR